MFAEFVIARGTAKINLPIPNSFTEIIFKQPFARIFALVKIQRCVMPRKQKIRNAPELFHVLK